MCLTAVAVRNAKPREKAYKLSDETGLYLQIESGGSKLSGLLDGAPPRGVEWQSRRPPSVQFAMAFLFVEILGWWHSLPYYIL